MFELHHSGTTFRFQYRYHETVLEYVQQKQDALSEHTRIFITLSTLEEKHSKTCMDIIQVYQKTHRNENERNRKNYERDIKYPYIPVMSQAIKQNVRKITEDLQILLEDPHQQIHPCVKDIRVRFGFTDTIYRDLFSWEVSRSDAFSMLHMRVPVADVINGELCRRQSIDDFCAVARALINEDTSTNHVANVGYGTSQIYYPCTPREFVSYTAGTIVRWDNRRRRKDHWLSLLKKEMHSDSVVLNVLDVEGQQFKSSFKACTMSQYANREYQKQQLSKITGHRRCQRYKVAWDNVKKLQAAHTAQMLSMLTLVNLTGDIVLPDVAPAYRPIALVCD